MGKRKTTRAPAKPRWGATKAQGKRFAEIRALKNRIADLERQLERANKEARYIANVNALRPSDAEVAAIGYVLHGVPFPTIEDLGLTAVFAQLHGFHRRTLVAIGKEVTEKSEWTAGPYKLGITWGLADDAFAASINGGKPYVQKP